MLGKLYGIGVGPGDPELLTLKAVRILENIDYLCYPISQPGKPSIALEIAAGAVRKHWFVTELYLPMTRDESVLEEHWQEAALKVADILESGQDCAFITLGDPSLYSTFVYLVRKLKVILAEFEVEIVPGISSPNILAAQAQVTLAEGEESFIIIPGISDLDKIGQALDSYDNIIFLKVGRTFPEIYQLLQEKGLEDKAVFGERCGFTDEYLSFDLRDVVERQSDYLSLLLVKKGGLK
ncbi:MAG: hypothetical protein JM58_15735 [Peptococcaceae bacterium BICA1-8]|nr:MAG: hypothetical protein JM58_15735 [Peptococcaceae bacterium BICA1-8]